MGFSYIFFHIPCLSILNLCSQLMKIFCKKIFQARAGIKRNLKKWQRARNIPIFHLALKIYCRPIFLSTKCIFSTSSEISWRDWPHWSTMVYHFYALFPSMTICIIFPKNMTNLQFIIHGCVGSCIKKLNYVFECIAKKCFFIEKVAIYAIRLPYVPQWLFQTSTCLTF